MLYIGCPAYKNLQIYAFPNEILRLHFFEAVKLRFEGVLSKANNSVQVDCGANCEMCPWCSKQCKTA